MTVSCRDHGSPQMTAPPCAPLPDGATPRGTMGMPPSWSTATRSGQLYPNDGTRSGGDALPSFPSPPFLEMHHCFHSC